MFGGDSLQVLPIIVQGSQTQIKGSYLKMLTLWPSIQVLKLKRNMRVQSIGGNSDFSRYLLRIGEGKKLTVMFGDHGDYIRIPDNLLFSTEGSSLKHAHEKQLIRFIYPNIIAGCLGPHDFIDRAILTALHSDVDLLNNLAIDMLPITNSRTYIAQDSVIDDSANGITNYPQRY